MTAVTPSACPDENALLAWVDRALTTDAREAIAQHLERCLTCAEVLRSLGEASAVRAREASIQAAQSATPRDLLHQHLESDAPARERRATALVALITAVAVGLTQLVLVPLHLLPPVRGMTVGLSVFLLWALGWSAILRRGYWRPWVPYLDAAVETSGCALLFLVLLRAQGPEVASAAPLQVLWGGAVLFSALRFRPRLCLFMGSLTAAEIVVVGALGPPLPAFGLFGWTGLGIRALMLFLCGVGGALVASQLVQKADEALRVAREQDLMGKYVLHERLGAGGMAEVYRATYCPEGGFRKTVVIKRVLTDHSGDPLFLEALREEARLGAMLAHPNVIQVHDCGVYRGSFIMAMEFVDGISLAALIDELGVLPPSAVAYVGASLCAALEYLHTRRDEQGLRLGLVHRDLNPPNVLLSWQAEVKLGDFGVAKARDRRAIGTRGFYGKEAYASPEQLRGDPVDGRTDLYALGLTLREALTGVRPDLHPEAPEAAGPAELPGPLEAILRTLEAKEPSHRPPSAAQVRAAFEGLPPELSPAAGRVALARCLEQHRGRHHPPRPDTATTGDLRPPRRTLAVGNP